MALTALLLLATALCLFSLTAGKPYPRASGQAAQTKSCQCSSFNSAICNSIDGQGYNHAVFPNPLSPSLLTTAQAAEAQANIYIPLAATSGCSKSVTKFLCFSYFPLCSLATPSVPPVLPCPSFCRKVRADCEPYLKSMYGLGWPQWLDCDNMERVLFDSQNLCVNETEIAESSNAVTPTRVQQVTTSAATTTPSPTTLVTPSYINDRTVCGVCNPRTNVSSGTFRVAVNNYTFGKIVSTAPPPPPPPPPTPNISFILSLRLHAHLPPSALPLTIMYLPRTTYPHAAAKVTVESRTIIDHVITYRVAVIDQYLPNCSNSANLPRTGALLTAYPEQCSFCFEMQSGQTYIVGGYHYPNNDGGVTWEVPRKRGVIAPWTEKYDSRLRDWMKAAASDRTC